MGLLIHKEITHEILSSAFEVSNQLGVGFLEKVYENALKVELEQRGLRVETQKRIVISYKGEVVGTYMIDLLVEGKVIIEVKNAENIIPNYKAQLMNYLKATGIKVGLIINFGKTKVQFERIIF